jgi:two-component system sensor histidine kinase RegB
MSNRSEVVRHDVAWLPLVRWGSCGALWILLATVWLFPHLNLSLRAVAPLGLAAAICRTLVIALSRRDSRATRVFLGLSLCADAVLLTGLLDITGGPFNPFIVMFVAYVWLGAVGASVPWALLVTAVSVGGFGWLVLDHVQAEASEHHRLNDFPAHLFTMWFAGATIAELVAHYVARAREALAQRQQQLEEARERALRSEHLAALTTLAAGAAHELSTPLATIAVAARELEREADRLSRSLPPVAPLREDAQLIRSEVDRCQLILDSMSGRAPDGGASAAGPLDPSAIADLVRARLSDDQRSRLRVAVSAGVQAPAAPGAGVVQAISSLLKNAFDASAADAQVRLQFEQRDGSVQIAVHDTGTGMPPEVLRRAGEPFYTTKATGRGMGLGVFLTRTFAERCGGSVRFDTTDGTTAILELPAAITREGAVA